MTTAALAIANLCRTLDGDSRTRLIDVTRARSRGYTGSDISQMVHSATRHLRAAGVNSNDTTLFAIRPSSNAISYLLALLTIGSRTALIDLRDAPDLVAAKLRQLQPNLVLTEPIIAAMARKPIRSLLKRIGRRVPPIHNFASRIVTTRRRRSGGSIGPPPRPDDDALVVFTSGTVSEPKAVVHTQRTLGTTFTSMLELIGDSSTEVVYTDQFHSLLPALAGGATVIFGSVGAPPDFTLRQLMRYEVTTWFTTPPAVVALMPELAAVRSLRRIVAGSSPVTAEFVKDLKVVSPALNVTGVYAMTEAAPIAVAEGDAISAYGGNGHFVGRPVAGLTVDLDRSGEIIVSGPHVGRYLKNEAGPIHAGDLGHFTDSGELVLDGRSKDMILCGARNIYPQHHEPALGRINGVKEAALIGRSDMYGDEEVWLLVDRLPGSNAEAVARALVESDHGATLPIQGVVFAPIPRSGRSNKVDRDAARRLVTDAADRGTVYQRHSR